uniref:Ig-like domain-containing protein n=1 Tax=Kryptolebias marmoratus TaxID=37003 RepID=A0A3Q3ANF8_KRYMA
MSTIHTWACFLLWISVATQEKMPDVTVTCFISEECGLPCNFQPGRGETVEWFRQDVLLYKFERNSSSKDYFKQQQLAERASISPQHISNGNATLMLRRSGLKDRGTYRCHVRTSAGEHNAKVILKVEAPIRDLFLELSRLSGYEEMKCTVRDVFPAPRVTWVTEPPTFELRPITRKEAGQTGLFTVNSRLRKLAGHPDLIYICKVTSSYGGPSWISSLRKREIKGPEGKDLTIPCRAPTHLNNPSLSWTFSNGKNATLIFRYDSQSMHSDSSPLWVNHVELDSYRVSFGDGSLRLMDPKHSEHSGSYTCEFALPYSKHTEHSKVTIDQPPGQAKVSSEEPSYWWVICVVAALLLFALAGVLVYLKLKGKASKPRNNPDEERELNRVKDAAAAQ